MHTQSTLSVSTADYVSDDTIGNLMEHILGTLEPTLTSQLKALVGLVCRWDVQPPIMPNRTRYLDLAKARRFKIDHEVTVGMQLARRIFATLEASQLRAFVDMLDMLGVTLGPEGKDTLGRSTRCLHTAIGRIPFA